MHPAVKVVSLGVMAYALQNVLIDQYLRKFSTTSLLVCLYTTLLLLALVGMVFTKDPNPNIWTQRNGWLLGITVMATLANFVGDFSFYKAYQMNGSLVTVTTIAATFPVMASIIQNLFFERNMPNSYQIIAYSLVFVAILFSTKGEQIKEQEKETLKVESSTLVTPATLGGIFIYLSSTSCTPVHPKL